MSGLSSNFADQLIWSAVVGTLSLAAAVVTALVRPKEVRSRAASRVLAGGSALIIVIATATGPLSSGGDLVLEPGRAGLGDLDQILADPTSLAGVLLISNVLLYAPFGFFGALGWRSQNWLVLGWALMLSLTIESVQFFLLGRVASTDDVLLNLLGAIIGLLAARSVAGIRSST